MYNINYIRTTSLRFLINARMYDCTHVLKQESFLVPRFLVVTTRGNGSITLWIIVQWVQMYLMFV